MEKSLKIFSQVITGSTEKLEVYKCLLKECGVKFEETEVVLNDTLLRDLDLDARTYNVLRSNISNFFTITLSEFCEKFPRNLVMRYRNLGKKSVAELSKELGRYGFGW